MFHLAGGHLLLLSEVATSCSCWPTGQKLQLLITTCWDWPSWDWPGWWPTCWSCSNCATKQVSQQMIFLISTSWDLWMDHLFHDPDKKKCSYVLASTPPPRLVSCWLMGVSGCGRRRTNADLKLLIYTFLQSWALFAFSHYLPKLFFHHRQNHHHPGHLLAHQCLDLYLNKLEQLHAPSLNYCRFPINN